MRHAAHEARERHREDRRRLAGCELAELASDGVVIHGSGAAYDEIRRLIAKHRVCAPSSAAIRSMVAFQERNTDTYSADIDFVDEDGKPTDLRMLLVVDEASTERPTYTVWSVLVP